jgi:hypothetical protein
VTGPAFPLTVEGLVFTITPGQLVELIGWSVAGIAVVAVLIKAAIQFGDAVRDACNGRPWPSMGILAGCGLAAWACSQAPAPPSARWWSQPVGGLFNLFYGTVIGLFPLLQALAVLALIAAVPLGVYAALVWMSSPVDPPRWGQIIRAQRLLIGRRLYQQERRIAKALSTWPRQAVALFVGGGSAVSLPQIVTWFLVDQDVKDLDELRQAAADAPMVRRADPSSGDGRVTRVRVEWDVAAVVGTRTSPCARPGLVWPLRRNPRPVPVIPVDHSDIS